MSRLAFEHQAFMRFMNKARERLIEWHGPHCNYDPPKITVMAAREWDSMLRVEQKPFFLPQQPNSISPEKVIEQRNHLHQLHNPRRLAFLEFIIKTSPLRPTSAYFWFLRLESQHGDEGASSAWACMTDLDRSVYDHCAVLDRNRYKFERESYKAKLMTLEPNEDGFELKDFLLTPSDYPSVETLGQMMKHSGTSIRPPIKEKRPRMPFSLFIEDHRYAIREKNPRFQFGEHLRLCSEAWSKMTPEEKMVYTERSKKLQKDWETKWAEMPEDELPVANAIAPDMFSHRFRSDGVPTKPSHLWLRAPSVKRFLVEYNSNLPETMRKDLDQMSDPEKAQFHREFEARKEAVLEDKAKKLVKLMEVKALMKEARELASIKQRLMLKFKSYKHEKMADAMIEQLSQSYQAKISSDEMPSVLAETTNQR